MVDIPGLIEKTQKTKLADNFTRLQLMIASNSRVLEEDAYKNLVRDLTKNFNEDSNESHDKLDRHALEALRLMTNMGANKTGGR